MTRYVPGLPAGARPDQLPVGKAQFVGKLSNFLGVLVAGAFLQLVTFGFYRFWLKTRIRQHLWSNTRIGEDALEYTGTARELLIGFLVALAVLAPIYVIYFLLGLEAERLRAFASLPLALILTALGYYAAFRARRYRATRTSFRGLRFWMTGSGWRYAARALAWDTLVVVTIGLALPWRAAALERYKMNCTRFGDLSGKFAGTGWSLFKRGMSLWLLALLCVVAAIAIPPMTLPRNMGVPVVIASLCLAAVFVLLVVLPLFSAVRLKWLLEGIRLGDISLASDLKKLAVLRCYWAAIGAGFLYLFAVAALLGVVLYAAIIAGFITRPNQSGLLKDAGAYLFIVTPAYLLLMLGLSTIKTLFIDRCLWKAAANTSVIINIAALDAVVASGDAAASVGEGLADALDVGAI